MTLIKIESEEPNGTRVEITQDLNELLDQEVKKLKERGAKGASKKNILSQLVKAGLDYQQVSRNANGSVDPSDTLGIIHPPTNRPNEYIIESKSELQLMQQALVEKEDRLIKKERHLNKREDQINNMHLSALRLREEASEMEMGVKKAVGNQSLNEHKLKELEAQAKELKQENKNLNREMLKLIKEIHRNTQKEIMKDYILPYLTPAMVGIDLFQNSQNKSGKTDPSLQHLTDTFSKLSKADQDKMREEMKGVVGKYIGASTPAQNSKKGAGIQTKSGRKVDSAGGKE